MSFLTEEKKKSLKDTKQQQQQHGSKDLYIQKEEEKEKLEGSEG